MFLLVVVIAISSLLLYLSLCLCLYLYLCLYLCLSLSLCLSLCLSNNPRPLTHIRPLEHRQTQVPPHAPVIPFGVVPGCIAGPAAMVAPTKVHQGGGEGRTRGLRLLRGGVGV